MPRGSSAFPGASHFPSLRCAVGNCALQKCTPWSEGRPGMRLAGVEYSRCRQPTRCWLINRPTSNCSSTGPTSNTRLARKQGLPSRDSSSVGPAYLKWVGPPLIGRPQAAAVSAIPSQPSPAHLSACNSVHLAGETVQKQHPCPHAWGRGLDMVGGAWARGMWSSIDLWRHLSRTLQRPSLRNILWVVSPFCVPTRPDWKICTELYYGQARKRRSQLRRQSCTGLGHAFYMHNEKVRVDAGLAYLFVCSRDTSGSSSKRLS